MNYIILVDDDEPMETAQDKAPAPKEPKISNSFEKRLILSVCKHRILYDHNHRLFSNVAKKEAVWQQIAQKLKADANVCKSTWMELRYKYQNYVRGVRKDFVRGGKRKGKTSDMPYASELLYLWRFVDDAKSCPLPQPIEDSVAEEEAMEVAMAEANSQIEAAAPTEPEKAPSPPIVESKSPAETPLDDDLILIEQPVELIVIDEDDDTKPSEKAFHVSEVMRQLALQIKKYPELYDSSSAEYNDYSRKSSIWNSIAYELKDKATKLMKCWIVMCTRYEWEVTRNTPSVDVARNSSELQRIMAFFEPYLLACPDTVYKQSYYLKESWHEPIDYFKDIYHLISRMKRVPEIVYYTDTLLNSSAKSEQFFAMWNDIPRSKRFSVGQCETTWLIMRRFYWELMNMRKQNYQLTDKWYFEGVITELYDLVKNCKMSSTTAKKPKEMPPLSVLTSDKPRTYGVANNMRSTAATSTAAVTVTVTSAAAAALSTSAVVASTASTSTVMVTPKINQPVLVQHPPLPKITSAISLAPQIVSKGSGALQIRPITMPQQNIILQANQQPVFINNVNAATKIVPAPTTIVQTAPKPSTIVTLMPPLVLASPKPPNQLPPTPRITIRPKGPKPSNGVPRPTTVNGISHATIRAPNSAMTGAKISIQTVGPSLAKPAPAAAAAITAPAPEAAAKAAGSALPKISGAVSLLNPNEILIELIASQSGNHLLVHGPPLSEKYQLSMPTVAKFIREILAIPLLHNKRHNQPHLINSYWDHISKKFNLPPHICRACWNFLVENFAHFPQIAPLKELMKPFSTTLSVWKDSTELFRVFDEHALSKGWLAHISRLPEVVECIGDYPVLYKDVGKNVKNGNSDMEALCAWRTIALRFPSINDISVIWTSFKNIFCQYMSDLEFGVDNKWHINWWRVLARLKFLVEARYSSNEPYYYIVSNKMVEEIERCALIEMKKRYGKEEMDMVAPKANVVTVKPERTSSPPTTTTAGSPTPTASETRTRKWDVEMVSLLTAIEKYPIIYEKGDCFVKYEAWKKVAKELHRDVSDCLLAFRRACQKYCMYKKLDSLNRCELNQKYFKRFDSIFNSVRLHRFKINVRTPFQLNQSLEGDKGKEAKMESVFPERYISDISMWNCDSNLVVKNWMYAVGNLPNVSQEIAHIKIRNVLAKHLKDNMVTI